MATRGSIGRGEDFNTWPDACILVVDDDPAALRLLIEALRLIPAPRFRILSASSVVEALAALDADSVGLCLTDFDLVGETGLDLFRAARNRGLLLPFVAITGAMEEDPLAEHLLSVGFDDVLLKRDLQGANLHRILRNAWLRNRSTADLVEHATVDELTGLLNRRGILARLQIELTRMERVRLPLALLYMDLDGFKQINDTLGHAAGDMALVHFSGVLKKITRSGESIGRLGGDEFVIVLPSTTAAMAVSAELRLHLELQRMPCEYAGTSFPLRASIGTFVQEPTDPIVTTAVLLQKADRRMYDAKAARRKKAMERRVD